MDERAVTDWFSKPGDSIIALMQRRGVSPQQLARSLKDGMTTLRGLCDGSVAVDAPLATTLSEHLGGSRAFWLQRQANFEAAVDRAVGAAAETDADNWLDRVPSPTGKKLPKKLTDEITRDELRSRLVYFNVPKLEAWERQYGSLVSGTRFRTSQTFISAEDSVLRWLRRGEMEAELTATAQWSVAKLQERLSAIRRLVHVSQPSRFLPQLRRLLAEAGVALVVVKAPTGCRASGATRMVTPDKAMILMSFRHRADDQFWFTLFHEIGHLVLHSARTFVDQDGMLTDESEKEANDFSSSALVPLDRVGELEELNSNREAILRFSRSIGVSPGVTVGQMQHREIISPTKMNWLKRRWSWDDIEPALN
ncbi:ImmA/IrrE family metallo-endopeptidase [Devosia sp. A16]|uniref:ImmA/IrrE family metallo-endopeptidase n=1 Tax=Devosia sp. A16 TaxID=1736675 RepID=UPI0006D83166|nr:ImmA/IrrE family metallo-endopeptidase [Devosia sp. A16]